MRLSNLALWPQGFIPYTIYILNNSCRIVVCFSVVLLWHGCASDPTQPAVPPAPDIEDTSDSSTPDVAVDTSVPDIHVDTYIDTYVPPSPTMIEASAPVEATVETLYTGAALYAKSLSGNTVLIDTADQLLQVFTEGDEPTELNKNLGVVHDVALLADDTLVLSTSLGVYVQIKESFIESPLTDYFADALPVSLMSGPTGAGDSLWIAANDTLYLWRNDEIFTVELPGFDTVNSDALMWTYGSQVDGKPALWLAIDGVLLAVQWNPQDDSVLVWTLLEDATNIRMAADGNDHVWVVQDGDIHRRGVDDEWEWLRLENEAVVDVGANQDDGTVWFVTDKGYWLYRDGQFHPVSGATPEGTFTVDSAGRVLTVTEDAVRRVNPGEPQLPTVSWVADIEPIHMAECAGCHGPVNYFVEEALYLDTPAQWEANIDIVLEAIEPNDEGLSSMPLGMPTMSSDDRLLIKYWKMAGFPVE